MTKKLAILFAILLASVIVSTGHVVGQSSYEGVVSVESVNAEPGSSFGVKIRLTNNNTNLSGIFIPMEYDPSGMVYDSVSLAGAGWGSDFTVLEYVQSNAPRVGITVIPSVMDYPLPAMTVPDTIIAELFFTLTVDAQPGQRVIDSLLIDTVFVDTAYGIDIPFRTQVSLANSMGETLLPAGFSFGSVTVGSPTGVEDRLDNSALPTDFALEQNYPNPFNPSTVISLAVPKAGVMKLEVFNILGQAVATPLNGWLDAGLHQVEFDGSEHPSGIYFYRLSHDSGSLTRKMILLK